MDIYAPKCSYGLCSCHPAFTAGLENFANLQVRKLKHMCTCTPKLLPGSEKRAHEMAEIVSKTIPQRPQQLGHPQWQYHTVHTALPLSEIFPQKNDPNQKISLLLYVNPASRALVSVLLLEVSMCKREAPPSASPFLTIVIRELDVRSQIFFRNTWSRCPHGFDEVLELHVRGHNTCWINISQRFWFSPWFIRGTRLHQVFNPCIGLHRQGASLAPEMGGSLDCPHSLH
mmetsp:Transcript_63533/g.105992  ORF Transcript_63533/g.105992 Transcript_63533/m.105992 type:complete len:229 (-) Transcript_63533:115-801(-)